MHRDDLPPWSVMAAAFLAGSVPFSNLAARRLRGVDLRTTGSGTVSGTSLYRVAGFGPLAVVGCLELAKGAVGPVLAGRRRPELGAGAAGLGVAGHNWSPFLAGAGGRGISPALGGLLVSAPEGTALLAVGLAGGRLSGHTALGSFLAMLGLAPALAATRGRRGAWTGVAIVLPLLAKRLLGNGPPEGRSRLGTYLCRLVLDRDVLR
ncbi:MAG TPA: glycerol-3-phosphate acyltransferase [Acidimicrobiales bacterium]